MEDDMRNHLAVATIAATSLLFVAACDSRDYEAEIATLETDLQGARSENEQMRTELDELRAQSEAQPGMAEGGLEDVQSQLNNVMQTAAGTFERMASMTQQPDASPEQRTEALDLVRADMQVIVQSVRAAADNLGVELETVAMDTDAGATEGTPEPAAGPEAPAQEEEPAAQEEEPAAEEEQPATAQ
jgi:multidrug resistance efflux pump